MNPAEWALLGVWALIPLVCLFVLTRARRRQKRQDDASGEHRVATWVCHCGVQVPVMATVRHVAVLDLDHTDVHAHQLTHESEAR